MKYLIFALIIPALILTSCTKENITINEDSETSVYNRAMITGKWNVEEITTKLFNGQQLVSNESELFGEGNNGLKSEIIYQSNGDFAKYQFEATAPSPETYYGGCDYYNIKENMLYMSTFGGYNGYINELNEKTLSFTMVQVDGNNQLHKVYRLNRSTDVFSVTH